MLKRTHYRIPFKIFAPPPSGGTSFAGVVLGGAALPALRPVRPIATGCSLKYVLQIFSQQEAEPPYKMTQRCA